MRAQGRQYVEHKQDENMTKPSALSSQQKAANLRILQFIGFQATTFLTIIINNYIPNIFDKTIT
jgi:hypothetical protein